MKKLLVAAIMVVLATPAFAAVQNVKVSGSVTSYFVDRSNFDLNSTSTPSKFEQNFFYTSSHVLISSDLSDNVSAQVGLANEVVWGDQSVSSAALSNQPSNSSDQNVDLELANITLREFLYSPLTLTIGRQSLSYGNDFLIGAAGGTSVGTMANVATDMSRTQNYDGIRAVLDYKPLTIDLVYVKTNSNNLTGNPSNAITLAGGNKDDQDLYGGVANYQLSDPFSTDVEASFWARTDHHVNLADGGKPSTLYVPDLRVSTNPTKDLNLGVEGALQFGNNYVSSATPDANEKITKAFALQGRASYNLPVLVKYKPSVSEVVSYYSGNPGRGATGKSSDKTSAWATMYNDQDLGTTIWRALFNPTNLMTSELSISVAPLEDVTAKVTWTDLMLADSVGTSGANIITNEPDTPSSLPAPTSSKDTRGLGNEIDGVVTYAYTEDVSFGLNLGIFKPGSIFSNHDSKASATEAIASVGVNF